MFDDPEIVQWLNQEKRNLEGIKESAIFASLVSESYLTDPKCMLQLGAALCLDKPICLIILDNAKVPDKLFQVADKVIFTTRDEEGMRKSAEEMAEWAATIPEKEL